MVVGPPGTGKTDVAVQIMSELYHNFPEQRTLLVTHSNHALNDLFEKIMQRDIPERYLLRLGHGAEGIERLLAFSNIANLSMYLVVCFVVPFPLYNHSDKDFSRFGRINEMLRRRLELLGEVAELAKSLRLPDDAAYTCETAGHFFLFHIVARWEKFQADLNKFKRTENDEKKRIDFVAANFPFTKYCAPLSPGDLFKVVCVPSLHSCLKRFEKRCDLCYACHCSLPSTRLGLWLRAASMTSSRSLPSWRNAVLSSCCAPTRTELLTCSQSTQR